MKKHFLFIFCIGLLLKTTPSFAWGKKGHAITAEIAKVYMTPATRDSVNKYLGNMSFEDAANWMDEMRKDPKYDFMKTWHYIDIPKDKTHVRSEDKDADIVNELETAINKLNNKQNLTQEQINFNIKVLFHLVGDLHQPLHVGYAIDKGGNTIKVMLPGGKQDNLHWVWDTDIIEREKISSEDCLQLAKKMSPKEIKQIQQIDVVKWAEQSRSLLPDVYDFKDGVISEAYITKNTPVIEKQLLMAGMRLAAIMNKTFSKQLL